MRSLSAENEKKCTSDKRAAERLLSLPHPLRVSFLFQEQNNKSIYVINTERNTGRRKKHTHPCTAAGRQETQRRGWKYRLVSEARATRTVSERRGTFSSRAAEALLSPPPDAATAPRNIPNRTARTAPLPVCVDEDGLLPCCCGGFFFF